MLAQLKPLFLALHVIFGSAGFLTGSAAILIPKFRKTPAVWHRWIGRIYATSMIGMALLSIPLAFWTANLVLLIIGVVTLFWVIAGWVALRRLRKVQAGRMFPSSRLRWHATWMSSSYIAAWTAFLINIQPFGDGLPWMIIYSIGPTIVGSFLISRTVARLSNSKRVQAEKLSSSTSGS